MCYSSAAHLFPSSIEASAKSCVTLIPDPPNVGNAHLVLEEEVAARGRQTQNRCSQSSGLQRLAVGGGGLPPRSPLDSFNQDGFPAHASRPLDGPMRMEEGRGGRAH